MAIVTVGIDHAKNVSVFAVNFEEGPQVKLRKLIANLRPSLIGMKACSGAHH